jgi:hypothetical protein
LFSGVESFDEKILRSYNKRQNTAAPQVEMIRNCLEAGIVFTYGIIMDTTSRSLDELRAELAFILSHDEITLPAFYTLVIPLLGTPYFRESVERGAILPNVRLRDLNGATVSMHGCDPLDETVAFARDLVSLRGYRARAYRHALSFHARYRKTLSPLQHVAAAANAFLTTMPTLASSPANIWPRADRPSYFAPSEPLDGLYEPAIRVDEAFRGHFRPTMVTGPDGDLAPDMLADFGSLRAPATGQAIADQSGVSHTAGQPG